jgi:hypothetical protein
MGVRWAPKRATKRKEAKKMASLNRLILAGNLTRDPELRFTKDGAAVCSFGLGGVSAIDDEADSAFVPLPPELWCAAFWEEDAG